MSRRRLLAGGAIAVGGTALAGTAAARLLDPDRLPLDGGYAPAGNALGWTARGGVRCVWHVPTNAPVVALTFDDGPLPDWTPRVLDILDRLAVPATFFLVGERVRRHPELVAAGRYDAHEVGNHTWSHADLGRLDAGEVLSQLRTAHEEIVTRLGRVPRLMRPPWGHLGGSTLIAADLLGYDVVLWSQPMPERQYAGDPDGFVRRVVADARPGSILLAHDVGDPHRLITVDNLAEIVGGLRAKGLRLVTFSELLASAAAPAAR
jgi:peptidoglycan/xylan/chitin deacetylase (PgdA/CDA1 family)